MSPPEKIKTALVCYTQLVFEDFVASNEPGEDEVLVLPRQIARLAGGLASALKESGIKAEEVKLPQGGFSPADTTRAAFNWRLLDLSESNGIPVDLVICLDYPAWSLRHPYKICWLTSLPRFLAKGLDQKPDRPGVGPEIYGEKETFDSRPVSERRGLNEAARLLAASREVAQELARYGLPYEYNPLPLNPAAPDRMAEYRLAIKRLLAKNDRR